MQKLMSLELSELRKEWNLFLQRTVDSFEWGDRKCAETEALIQAASENLNDSVYFTVLEEVMANRKPSWIVSKVNNAIDELLEDSAFVNDCLGTEETNPAHDELFMDYVHYVNNSVTQLKSDHWSMLVSDAQNAIVCAARANGAFGWVSSVCLDTCECAVMLLDRADVEVERRQIISETMTVSECISMLECEGIVDATFGTERFVYVVNEKFISSDEHELNEGDVLIIYKVKRS